MLEKPSIFFFFLEFHKSGEIIESQIIPLVWVGIWHTFMLLILYLIYEFSHEYYLFVFLQVKTLEFFRLAPEGSQRVQSFLETTAEALVEGGR